jgi:hypothetical protein
MFTPFKLPKHDLLPTLKVLMSRNEKAKCCGGAGKV